MKINVWRDPYDSGFNTTKPKEIELHSGLTVLVGCNGAGKTTLLLNIKDDLKAQKIPVHSFDNLSDGGRSSIGLMLSGGKEVPSDTFGTAVSLWDASEGEAIKIHLGRQSTLYKEFFRSGYFKNKDFEFASIFANKVPTFDTNVRVLLYDATDSGLSIDSICEIKEFFELLFADAKKEGIDLYIIISANEYELCRNESCFDVNEGKYLTFSDYEDYRRFILNSRKKKEKRIEKQEIWQEKQREKIKLALQKLEEKYGAKKVELEAKASAENRSLSYSERNKLDALQREIDSFKRHNSRFL